MVNLDTGLDSVPGRFVADEIPGVVYRQAPVASHNGAYVYPGRLAVEGAWPFASPEVCQANTTRWIADDQVLVCTGCGLNVT